MSPKKGKSVKKAPKAKPLSARVVTALENKAKDSKFTFGELKSVFRRGQGAWLQSGSRNVDINTWAFGRVDSFVTGDAEIKRTAEAYRKGEYIDIKAVSKSRVAQNVTKKRKKRKKSTKS